MGCGSMNQLRPGIPDAENNVKKASSGGIVGRVLSKL